VPNVHQRESLTFERVLQTPNAYAKARVVQTMKTTDTGDASQIIKSILEADRGNHKRVVALRELLTQKIQQGHRLELSVKVAFGFVVTKFTQADLVSEKTSPEDFGRYQRCRGNLIQSRRRSVSNVSKLP